MAIPAKFRDALVERGEGRLLLTADLNNHLMLFAYPDWLDVERRIMALPSYAEQTRRLQRLYVGNAEEVALDSANRVLIPSGLRSYAAIDKKVVMVGQGARYEIWNEEAWARELEACQEQPEIPDTAEMEALRTFSI